MKDSDLSIDRVMNDFDFDRILQVMQLLGWRYGGPDGVMYQPDLEDIRRAARQRLSEVLSQQGDGTKFSKSGGFLAVKHLGFLSLSFVVESSSPD